MKKNSIFILIGILLLINISSKVSFSEETFKEKQILVIYAANPLLPAINEFFSTLNQELIEEGFGARNVHFEFIDRQYRKKEGFDKTFTTYIKEKYNTDDIDVVVSQGRESTIWLNKTNLFKNANFVYVFSGGSRYKELDYEKNTGYFITGDNDSIKTVKEGLRLVPNIENIILIHGALPNEGRFDKEIIDYLKENKPEINVIVANNKSLDALKKDLSIYSDKTLGVYLSFFSDKSGVAHTPREVLAELYNEVDFPMVAFYSSYLDHGVLGGSMLSLSHEAERTVDYIVKALAKDEFDKTIEIGPEPQSIYDMNIIKAFQLNEHRIPPYASVINKKPSIWEAYKEYVISTILLFILLIVIIILSVILYNREKSSKKNFKYMNSSLQTLNAQLEEEIMEKEKAREDMLHMAMYDELTNLKNRRALKEDLKYAMSNNHRLALSLIDLDDFKKINDIRGHIVGDDILNRFSDFLEDKYSSNVYRIGGDEFAIIIYDYNEKNDLEESMNKLLFSIKNNLGIQYHLTASIGIVLAPKDSNSPHSLLRLGDIAMNESKMAGKNCVHFYEKYQSKAFEDKVKSEKIAREIIKQKAFQLYYQPIVSHKNGDFKYFEVLIRPTNIDFAVYEFITISEKIGLVSEITKSVLNQTFNQLEKWENEGLKKCKVSVNVSANDFKGEWLIEQLKLNLKKYNVDSSQIELEITENIFIGNDGENINLLNKIRELGFLIALDDFGTGYSSLSYLTFLPIDKLKLDKSLKNLWLKESSNDLILHLVNLAKSLHLDIVAEGIENKEEWDKLKGIDIDYLQGYLFDKALHKDEAKKYLE